MKKLKKNSFKLLLLLLFMPGGILPSQQKNKVRFDLLSVWENKWPTPLKGPEAISVSAIGDIYIADAGNNRLVKLSSDGTFLNEVGGFGWGINQFDGPIDVAARDGLNIYVADFNNQRIQRYSKKLEYISSFGNSKINQLTVEANSNKDIIVGYPSGLAVSSQGDLFYSDSEKGTITRINKFGRAESTFGGFAEGRGKLNHPTKLCVTSKFVYVVDGNRIVIFDYFGNYISDFGEKILKKASDAAVDEKERIYVSDLETKTVWVFDKQGAVINSLGGYSFEKPVSVDATRNRLVVLDNTSVMVFSITESGD